MSQAYQADVTKLSRQVINGIEKHIPCIFFKKENIMGVDTNCVRAEEVAGVAINGGLEAHLPTGPLFKKETT